MFAEPAAGFGLRPARADDHPVLAALRARADVQGGRPGSYADGRVLALAVEGGGMRGAVSAGMCVILEALDLVRCFDVVIGCSSGALNGSYTAAGQAAMGAANYEDTVHRGVTDLRRILGSRPVIDLDVLFDEVIVSHRPYDEEGLARGPEFRAVATALEGDGALRVLRDFVSVQELARAVRASCAMPLFAGDPVEFREEALVDGAFFASVPFRPALEDGATHVLALRSHTASFRMHPYRRVLAEAIHRRFEPPLDALLLGRAARYNEDAEALAAATGGDDDRVFQLCPAAQFPHVSTFERSISAVRAGLDSGVQAAAAMLADRPVAVHWEPRVRPVGRT